MRRFSVAVSTAAAVVTLVSCSSSSDTGSTGPEASETHAPPATSPARDSGPHLTGFGATDADWNAAHTPDPDFAPGAVYDPDPSLPDINGHTGAVYVAVNHEDGRVLNYSMNLPAGTSLSAALAIAKREFPRDATIVWQQHKDTCVQAVLRSATLGRALGDPKIGDSSGLALVEFELMTDSGDSAPSPRTFNSAVFNLGASARAADSPPC